MPETAAWSVGGFSDGDGEALASLRRRFWDDQVSKGAREPVSAMGPDALADLANRARTHLLVARVAGTPAGYLLGTTRLLPQGGGRVSTIEEIYVDPGSRLSGLGRALVTAALTAFKGDEADRIQLRVLGDNSEGAAFWRSAGFVPYVTTYELDR